MSKKGFIVLVGALVCYLSSFAQEKFGHVNSREIMQIMPEFSEAKKKIETESAQYETILNNLRNELNNKYAAFQQEQEGLSEGVKAMKIKEIQEVEQRTQNFYDEARQNIDKLQEQLMVPIQEKLVKAIQAVGDENGFTSIIETYAAIYLSPTKMVDVSSLVKAKLGIK